MATQHDNDHHEPANGNGDGDLYGVLAEFDTPGELVEAARKVRDAGYTDFDCFSPFPVHGIDDAMGIRRTILPVLIFGGGFAGLVGGIFMQWWMNAYDWPWNISGKPSWSIPANVPIAFETTILLSVFTAFFGMWILNKLPQVWHPFFRLDRMARATDDAFLLGIEAKDQRFDLDRTTKLLNDAGALAVENCYFETDPARKNMPKWITALIVSSTAFALIPFAIAAKARNSYSTEPHIHVFPDMDFQPKFKADAASDFFADGRANRGEVPGTVARGAHVPDEMVDFYRGQELVKTFERLGNECNEVETTVDKDGVPAKSKVLVVLPVKPDPEPIVVEYAPKDQPKDKPVAAKKVQYARAELKLEPRACWDREFPRQIDVTKQFLQRGQSRYNIYCSACHGHDGEGKGMIQQRIVSLGEAWAVRDLVSASSNVITMPNGQLYSTITNGFGTMAGYAAQIPPVDRWAIVMYVRALQRARNALTADIPPDEQQRAKNQQMQAPKPATEPKK